jgi:Zn-dependent M28 family amino/carboxypeptidase
MPLMKRNLALALAALALAVAASIAQDVPKSGVIDSAQLLADLRVLSSDEMEGRRVGTRGSEKARAFVTERFRASGVLPFGPSYESAFTFTTGRGNNVQQRGVNVIGQIEGKRTPRRYIVVSAHYDHLGVRNGVVFNGADDNASGTAALFAVAKYFATHQPENSLILAAFDAEEAGLQGSKAFLRQPPVEARLLALNINADMIGRDPHDKLFVVGTARQPFLRPYIVALAKKAPVKVIMGHEDPKQPEDWTEDSDHYSFMAAKIPALYVGVEDFDQHHQPTDDYATMSHSFYVRAVETLILAIQEFDADLDPVVRNWGR